MNSLARNDLVWIDALAWQQIQAHEWDTQAREILKHWESCDFPLVVGRQRADVPDQEVCLGLPAPRQWGLRRLALQAPGDRIKAQGSFPSLAQVARIHVWGPLVQDLRSGLMYCGVDARVYGSHGWQYLTGLPYLHEESDIDLTIQVPDFETARQVAQQLASTQLPQRLDGELVFAGGLAVAWRELNQLLAEQVAQIMVKDLHQVRLVDMSTLCHLAEHPLNARSPAFQFLA